MVHFLSAFYTFEREIKSYEKLIEESSVRVKKGDAYYNARRDTNRFYRKAQKILDNVSQGVFPGDF